jgi:hypothetical protein
MHDTLTIRTLLTCRLLLALGGAGARGADAALLPGGAVPPVEIAGALAGRSAARRHSGATAHAASKLRRFSDAVIKVEDSFAPSAPRARAAASELSRYRKRKPRRGG